MPEQHEIKDGLNRILFYLENDSRTGRKGLVTDVEDLKEDFKDLRNTLTNFIAEYRQAQAVKNAKVGLIGALAGAAVTGIGWLIKILT